MSFLTVRKGHTLTWPDDRHYPALQFADEKGKRYLTLELYPGQAEKIRDLLNAHYPVKQQEKE